ncbi:LysM peptidoglycan-binding domain-containing protein [Streptomyces sp. NPDC005533]|uniref:LysM peptidoglycan-binding domain-containing protein n=1 Tax=Streptomyces sp. NPDC005533 TaxID=3364723 RepID=UPI003674BC9F
MSKPTPKPSRPARGGAQAAAAAVRGLLSLLLLAGLLAGLPLLLWWATAIVGPPGVAALGSLFSTDDSGQVFLLALAVAGWVGWALFTCAVLLEIPAQIRGRAAPQIRGLVGQRAAAALVGAVLLALPTTTALAAPATAATAPVSISASAIPGTTTGGIGAVASTASGNGTAAQGTYTVRDVKPAESLWSIAEQTLGDGQRWEEIAHLNEGHTMTDGTVFRAEQPIHPGWVLTLPATTDAPSTRAHGTATERAGVGGEYTVLEGESLSGIADTQLGDAGRYMEIFDLNRGQALPDGAGTFTNPDLIYPGQRLTLPKDGGHTSPAPGTATPDAEEAEGDAAAKPPTTASPTPPATTAQPGSPTPAPATSPPSTSASAAPTPTAPSTPAPTPAASAPPAPIATDSTNRSPGINWALVTGVGTLLAASLTGALGLRRILQQRQRRAGQTIAQDAEPTSTEQTMAAAGEPAGVELLDNVLRTLARHSAEDGLALPTLRGAHLSEDNGVTLLLDEPAEPIPPFTAGPDTHTWVLDPQAAPASPGKLPDVQVAPYPGLVTLGADHQGLLLADLTTCRVLLLDGTADENLEVARALALELGTCRWTDYSEILTTGLGTRLAGLLPHGRIRTMPHLPAVAADLGELLLEAHQSGEQVLPWLLIAADDPADTDVIQLADALSAARHLQTAVVLPATDSTRRAFPHAEILDTTRGEQTLPALLERPVTLQRVTDEQYREYIHALQVSTEEPLPATAPWEFSEDHSPAAATSAPLTVRVTNAEATQDPGDPFPALFAGILVPATAAGQNPPQSRDPAQTGAGDQEGQASPAPPQQATGPNPEPEGHNGEVRIEMLGTLRITGGTGATHAHTLQTTAIAALIHLRPGRTPEYLCRAMDPVNPWSTRTLHSRLSELRSEIGLADDEAPLLPRPKNGAGYVFHPAVTSDWQQFQQLAAIGLAAGPQQGLAALEDAMALVRGRPFDGRTLPWADPVIQDMLSRITDTAHTLARWHTDGDTPDLDAARQTVLQALDIEETSEVLYRDLLHIEWAAGNPAVVRRTVARLQQMARTYDITLDNLTEDTINLVLSDRPSPAGFYPAVNPTLQ